MASLKKTEVMDGFHYHITTQFYEEGDERAFGRDFVYEGPAAKCPHPDCIRRRRREKRRLSSGESTAGAGS